MERERKYSGDDGFRLPDLTGCGGVTTVSDATALDLDAVYLDTADLRLARSGFALRRRTGGHDAGWHLKVGSAGGDRTEYQFPAGADDADPPAELVALFRAASRGQPGRPGGADHHPAGWSAGCSTGGAGCWRRSPRTPSRDATWSPASGRPGGRSRSSWSTATSALLDAVDAAAARGRGPPGARLQVAPGAGRPARRARGHPASPGAAPVLDYALAQRDALIAHHPGAIGGDEDAVHDMRVAVRRLRSTLRTFRGLLGPPRRASPLRAELRWLGARLGPVRDTQVMAARLADAVHAEPADLVLGPVAARISSRFAADLATALDELRRGARLRPLHRAAGPARRAAGGADRAAGRRAVGGPAGAAGGDPGRRPAGPGPRR